MVEIIIEQIEKLPLN